MKKQILVTISTLILISACSSSNDRKLASGGFEYLDVKEPEKALLVPEELSPPQLSNQYTLPNLNSQSGVTLLGDEVTISSPRLVLPLVSGSHVEEGARSAIVSFDQVDDSRPLDTTIWDKVLSYLEQNNIGVESFDRANNELVTDWVISRSEIDASWYEFTDQYVEHAKKFKLTLDMAPHMRTGSLKNEIVAYVNDEGDSNIASLDPITQRNNEVNFLNFIIAEYDFSVRLAQTQRINRIREGFDSSLGFNADGDSAFVINALYNNAWPRLLLVLRKMNFDVIDLDQSSGIMFVAYNGEDEGFFTNLFGTDALPLKQENYRIFVNRAGDNTSVTLKDDESVALDVETVTGVFPTFKELMASDNLDI